MSENNLNQVDAWDEVHMYADRLQVLLTHTMTMIKDGAGDAQTAETAWHLLNSIVEQAVEPLYQHSSSQLRKADELYRRARMDGDGEPVKT